MNILKPWRVARFDVGLNPVFDDRLASEPSVALDIAKRQGEDERTLDVLRAAHVYQITAAKDELPMQWHATQALLQQCPNLLCVSSTGAGYDTVDVDACTAAGVAVVSQIGGNAPAVAEMALGLMLSVSRRIVESDRKLRTERGFSRESLMGHDIGGKVLGLVGIGHAGTHTAKLAQAFGMRVIAVDPLLTDAQICERGAEPVSLATLLQMADIVSLHCPRDKSTLGLFDAQTFAAMKKGALFISTIMHDR